MPPAIIAVAATVAAAALPSTAVAFGIGLNVLVSAAITVGGGLIGSLTSRKKKQSKGSSISEQQQTIQSPNAPRTIVYGRKRVGGASVFMHTTQNNNFLHMIIALAGHEIQSVEAVYFDDHRLVLGTVDSANTVSGQPYSLETLYGTGWDAYGLQEIKEPELFADGVTNDLICFGLGSDGQAHNPVISALIGDTADAAPLWPESSRLGGVAYSYMRLNISHHSQGIPKISFIVRGKKLYDPRRDTTAGGSGSHRTDDPSTWEYSANAALVIADYITDEKGLGAEWIDIDIPQLMNAANTCDEIVYTTIGSDGVSIVNGTVYSEDHNLRDGLYGSFHSTGNLPGNINANKTYVVFVYDADYFGVYDPENNWAIVDISDDGTGTLSFVCYEPRYEAHGTISTDRTPKEVIAELSASMAGDVIYTGGKFYIVPGEYVPPGVDDNFDANDLRGDLTVTTAISRRERFNGLKGIYAEPSYQYQPADFPAMDSDVFAYQDGVDDGEPISSGQIEVGKGYNIISVDGGADFTGVGADANTPGIVFLATGITPTSELYITIFFDSSGSMNSTLSPLQSARSNEIKSALLPYYENDETLYNSRVTIVENSSERTFNMLNNLGNEPDGTTHVILIFQDEAQSVYTSTNNFTGSGIWNANMSALIATLNSSSVLRGAIFQVATPGTPMANFKTAMQGIETGASPYDGPGKNLADYNNLVKFYYDVTPASTGSYYAELIIQSLSDLGIAVNGTETAGPVFVTPKWGTGGQLQPKKMERIYRDIELPFTTSATACQRIAKIGLLRSRQEIVVNLPMKLSGMKLRCGDFFRFSYPRMGWTNKIFRVTDWTLAPISDTDGNPGLGVDIVAREAASTDYDWSTTEEQQIDPAPNTTLPSARISPTPTGLTVSSGTDQLILRGDGTIMSRAKLVWSITDEGFFSTAGYIESQYKKSTDNVWLAGPQVSSGVTQLWIAEVEDGKNYDFRIRSRNSLGVFSGWVTVLGYTVVGKTEPPNPPTNLALYGSVGIQRVTLTWDNPTDLDLSTVIIYRNIANSIAGATAIGKTLSASWDDYFDIQENTTYYYFLQSIDNTGNMSDVVAFTPTHTGRVPQVTNAFIEWTFGGGVIQVHSPIANIYHSAELWSSASDVTNAVNASIGDPINVENETGHPVTITKTGSGVADDYENNPHFHVRILKNASFEHDGYAIFVWDCGSTANQKDDGEHTAFYLNYKYPGQSVFRIKIPIPRANTWYYMKVMARKGNWWSDPDTCPQGYIYCDNGVGMDAVINDLDTRVTALE